MLRENKIPGHKPYYQADNRENWQAEKNVIPFESLVNRSRRFRINKYTKLICKLASMIQALKKELVRHLSQHQK